MGWGYLVNGALLSMVISEGMVTCSPNIVVWGLVKKLPTEFSSQTCRLPQVI